jgi:hypothetical protein
MDFALIAAILLVLAVAAATHAQIRK